MKQIKYVPLYTRVGMYAQEGKAWDTIEEAMTWKIGDTLPDGAYQVEIDDDNEETMKRLRFIQRK